MTMTTTILPTTNEAWGFWGTIGHETADVFRLAILTP